jgi:hypothetical protein
MEIDERDINLAAAKLRRFGYDFDLMKSAILAYEDAKEKRINGKCQHCNGTGLKQDEYSGNEDKK